MVFQVALKQAIVLRTDLQMGKGKLVAQGSHASLQAYEKALEKNESGAREWSSFGSEKIVLKVQGEKDLRMIFAKALKAKLPCALILDAGRTQIPPGTPTAVAIGPAEEKKVDAITGELKLL